MPRSKATPTTVPDIPEVFAAVSGGMKIERFRRIATALTLFIVSLPWVFLLFGREDPWGPRRYEPVSAQVALTLIKVAPVLVALVVLTGTLIAASRASTAEARLMTCMGGAFACFALPMMTLAVGDEWGRFPPMYSGGDYEDHALEGAAALATIGGLGAGILLGVPLSLLGIWALNAQRQPSIDRLWRYGRTAALLVAAVSGAQALIELWGFWHTEGIVVGGFHVVAACCAIMAAAVFSERARRMRRWLEAVRAGTVNGWRVRDLGQTEAVARPLMPFIAGEGDNAVLEMLEDVEQGAAAEPYRGRQPLAEAVAFVSA